MRKRLPLMVAVALATLTGPSYAAFRQWTGGAGTSNWFTAQNWNTGLPVSGDSPRIGIAATPVPTIWPVYNGDNSASPTTGAFLIAGAMDAWFGMAGGTFVHNSWTNLGQDKGWTGTWTQTDGTFNAAGRDFTIGNIGGANGVLNMSGGTINVGRFRTSNEAGTKSTVNLTGGRIACDTADWAFHSNSTLSIQDATFYSAGTIGINVAKDATAFVTVGGGGLVDADKIDFASCDVAIQAGGVIQARGLVSSTPVSILSAGRIDLQGGLLRIANDNSLNVQGWIDGGRLVTTLPGYSVAYSYDAGTNYTSVFAAIPEPTSVLLLVVGAGLLRRRR